MQSETIKKTILLAIVTLYSICSAADSYIVSDGYLTYYQNVDTKVITVAKEYKYCSAYHSTDVVIPSTVKINGIEYPIAGIEDGAFSNCTDLESITIEEGVSLSSGYIFSSCKNLKTVNLPSTLKTIGSSVFTRCTALKSIVLPEDLMSIGNYAFSDCSSLQSVTIGKNLSSVAKYAFDGCPSLTSIYYNGGHAGWESLSQNVANGNNSFLDAKVVFVNGPTYNGEEFTYNQITYRTIDADESKIEIIRKNGWPYYGDITIPASFNYCNIDFQLAGIADGVFTDSPSLSSIRFKGTKTRWKKLNIGNNNELLDNIPIIFDYDVEPSSGNNQLYIEESKVFLGAKKTLNLCLENKYPVTGFQFVLKLPSELSLAIDDNNQPVISFSGDRINPQAHDLAKIAKISENCYLIMCASTTNADITGKDGTILSFDVITDETFTGKTTAIEFSDLTIMTKDAENDRIPTLTLPLIVSEVTYTLTYMLDGVVYKQYELARNAKITPEEEPHKTGYTFSGWSEIPEVMPAHDMTITGSFSINNYCVTFIADGDTIQNVSLVYGSAITPPEAPAKIGHTFIGWNPAVDATVPAHDVTYAAMFTVNQYTITFDTDGGSEIEPITQDYNTAVTAPADPAKTGYTFAGWDREIPATMPAEDLDIKAIWTINQYALTYIVDGDTVKTDSLYFGATIIPLEEPTKEEHDFSGWSEIPEVMPAHDVTITGSFIQNVYMVRYYVNGELVHEEKVKVGESFTLYEYVPEDGYWLVGWDGESYEVMPAHDVEYYAIIEEYSGIDSVTGSSAARNSTYYDLSGRKVRNINKGGIIIKRLEDGRVVKLFGTQNHSKI